jgi:hypothetical protein
VRKGRDLELLVKDIKALKLPDAIIKSPEYVNDCDTGSPREVDIGIRFSPNKDYFIAIECRDRGDIQDIIWIEQLISKKRSIGADVLIAVTTSSFTSSAKIKAFKNGVVLRDLKLFTVAEIEKWLEETYIEIDTIQKIVKSISLRTQERVALCKPLNRYTFFFEGIAQELSFDEAISLIADDNIFLKVRDKLLKHGDKINFRITLDIIKDIFINIPPAVKVEGVKMELVAVKKIQRVPLVTGFNYIDSTDDSFIAEKYSYDLKDDSFSSLLIDSQSNEGQWELDFSKLKGNDDVVSSVLIKCVKPVVLKRFRLKTS